MLYLLVINQIEVVYCNKNNITKLLKEKNNCFGQLKKLNFFLKLKM